METIIDAWTWNFPAKRVDTNVAHHPAPYNGGRALNDFHMYPAYEQNCNSEPTATQNAARKLLGPSTSERKTRILQLPLNKRQSYEAKR